MGALRPQPQLHKRWWMYPPPAAAVGPLAPTLWNWRRVRGPDQLTGGATSRSSASMAAADILEFSAALQQMFRWTQPMGDSPQDLKHQRGNLSASQPNSLRWSGFKRMERKRETTAKAGAAVVRSGAQTSQRKQPRQKDQRSEAKVGSDSVKSPETLWSQRPAGGLEVILKHTPFLKVRGHLRWPHNSERSIKPLQFLFHLLSLLFKSLLHPRRLQLNNNWVFLRKSNSFFVANFSSKFVLKQ